MAERGGGGNEPREKITGVPKIDDDIGEEAVNKEIPKNQPGGGIAEVKSKIKEKNAEQQNPVVGEESVGTVKGLKSGNTQSTFSKLSKLGMIKRNKNKTSAYLETQDNTLDEETSDNALPGEVQKNSSTESPKMPAEAKVKKSSGKDSRKSSDEDDKGEIFQTKSSELSKKFMSESFATQDIEAQKNIISNTPSSITQEGLENPRRIASQRQILERGNYMNNVAPVPAEDLQDLQSETEKEEKKRR